jgi:two-component system chemotaxis response regulator CheB
MFAKRLNQCCALEISEARSGDLLLAGRVLISPGNRHLLARRMPRGDMAVLSDSLPVNGHRPSVDVLFHSVAQGFGPSAVGLLMTGMGEDGAEGLGAIKNAGGQTIAQSEDSCVVSGMPRAAMEKGYVGTIVPLEGIGAHLLSQYGGSRRGSEKTDGVEKTEKNETQKLTASRSQK